MLLLLHIPLVALLFFYILLVAVSAHVALLSFITEDGLKLLEKRPHHQHYLLGEDEFLDGGHFRSHKAGSEDDAEVVLTHEVVVGEGQHPVPEEVQQEEEHHPVHLR
jgi:hypothetical protein